MPTIQATIWEQLVPYIVSAATLIITAGGTFLVTWLRSKTAKLETVRQAVTEVEQLSARPDVNLTNEEKRAIALGKIRQARPSMTEETASTLIERVLPEVRQSMPPPPPSPPRIWMRGDPNLPPVRLEESASGLPTPKLPKR